GQSQQGRLDRADHRLLLDDEADADADHGQAAQEIGGPVERVDRPEALAALTTGLFREHGDAGAALAQNREHRVLRRPVGAAHVVTVALGLRLQRGHATVLPPNLGCSGGGGTGGDVTQHGEIEAHGKDGSAARSRSRSGHTLRGRPPSRSMSAPILVGTTNWVDHENFYPPELEKGRRQREKLSYYARFFPFVEVDTTFYGIPKPQVVDGWVERTPESFRFNVKAYRSLTRHEREAGKPRPPTAEEERDFKAALEPLRAAGRLTAVIYQFPPWFKDSPSARDVCAEARERHPDDVVAIEF